MTDLPAARARFLARVEDLAPGQGVRFAPALDELVAWSHDHGLAFDPPTGKQSHVRFLAPAGKTYLWAATPCSGDGAKLTVGGPEELLADARVVLAKIGIKPVNAARPPEVPFGCLIWAPYRASVLDMLGRLLPVAA